MNTFDKQRFEARIKQLEEENKKLRKDIWTAHEDIAELERKNAALRYLSSLYVKNGRAL